MKTFTQFLTAVAVLAIAQYVALALGIVLLIVSVMAAAIRPRQAIAMAATVGLFALAIKQPLAWIALLAIVGGAFAFAKRVRRQSQRAVPTLLLPPPS